MPFDPSRRAEWNRFVEEAGNGTEFHRIDFLEYHPADRFDFKHLMFYRSGKLVSVLPGAVRDGLFSSPSGASMGGFVVAPFAGLSSANEVMAAFVDWCAAEGVKGARIGQPMSVYRKLPDESLEFAMLYNGFTLRDTTYSSVCCLDRVGDRSDMPCKTRNNISRSQRQGVTVVDSDDLAAFYPLLVENKLKFGVAPTHTLEELKRIRKLRPDLLKLFLATLDGEPIAGLLLFLISPVCALNFYTAMDYGHRRHNPVSLLIEHSMRWCVEKGFRCYDYGVSMDTSSADPLEVSWSLVRFKESFGLTGCMRRTYGLDLHV